jgi:hypothetical protein
MQRKYRYSNGLCSRTDKEVQRVEFAKWFPDLKKRVLGRDYWRIASGFWSTGKLNP